MFAHQPRDAEKSLRVLIVGGDPALEEEFRSALSRVPDRRARSTTSIGTATPSTSPGGASRT